MLINIDSPGLVYQALRRDAVVQRKEARKRSNSGEALAPVRASMRERAAKLEAAADQIEVQLRARSRQS